MSEGSAEHVVLFNYHVLIALSLTFIDKTWSERMLRQIVFGYLPQSVLHKDTIKAAAYRPQCMFLPLTPDHGKCFVLPQKPSKRYQEEQMAKADA